MNGEKCSSIFKAGEICGLEIRFSWCNSIGLPKTYSFLFKFEIMKAAKTFNLVGFQRLLALVNGTDTRSNTMNWSLHQSCMHVMCNQNIMSFVAISTNTRLHWAKNSVANIFAILWLRKVTSSDLDPNSFSDVFY